MDQEQFDVLLARVANLENTVAVLAKIAAPQLRMMGFVLPTGGATTVASTGGSAEIGKHGSKIGAKSNMEVGQGVAKGRG